MKIWNEGKLLILDVDGVMIDPHGSFENCAAMALNEIAPELNWSNELYWKFKRVTGLNNDFRLTAAAVAVFESGELNRLDDAVCMGFPHLEERIAELEPYCKERVQFFYQDVKHTEAPLITLPELEAIKGWDKAILTGRPPEELVLAFEILGFEMPAVCDSKPEFCKPAPGGLIHLADTYNAKRVFFVGDTTDDATCLRRARTLRPDLDLTFVAVNWLRHEISQPGDLTFPTLRDFISSDELDRN